MGIGTLKERTLHAMLKRHLCEDESCHEVTVGAYVADILCKDEIIEIQTRNFEKLKPKLKAFLQNYTVTVVYPVSYHKWITWVDPRDGTLSQKRKSPKVGSAHDVFFELYKIREYLCHPNFRLKLVFVDVDEYRSQNGWSRDGKKGSERIERVPLELRHTITCTPDDYRALLPDFGKSTFTAKEYQKRCKCTPRSAWRAIRTLCDIGTITHIATENRTYIYQIN